MSARPRPACSPLNAQRVAVAAALLLTLLAAGCTKRHLVLPPTGGNAAADLARNQRPGEPVPPAPERSDALDGVTIRLIHVSRGKADAEEAAGRLRSLGADVRLFPTSDSGNEPHAGKLYTKAGHERYADAIREAVGGLEDLRQVPGGVFSDGQHFNLWIVK